MLPKEFEFVYAGCEDGEQFTATFKDGMYYVTWSGMEGVPVSFTFGEVEDYVKDGVWKIVDVGDVKDDSLPDKFKFRVMPEYPEFIHSAKVVDHTVKVEWSQGFLQIVNEESPWTTCTASEARDWITQGGWEVGEETPLTTEQLRRNKEINELVAQLDASIKIAEQTICHHERLIASYNERKKILKALNTAPEWNKDYTQRLPKKGFVE